MEHLATPHDLTSKISIYHNIVKTGGHKPDYRTTEGKNIAETIRNRDEENITTNAEILGLSRRLVGLTFGDLSKFRKFQHLN